MWQIVYTFEAGHLCFAVWFRNQPTLLAEQSVPSNMRVDHQCWSTPNELDSQDEMTRLHEEFCRTLRKLQSDLSDVVEGYVFQAGLVDV